MDSDNIAATLDPRHLAEPDRQRLATLPYAGPKETFSAGPPAEGALAELPPQSDVRAGDETLQDQQPRPSSSRGSGTWRHLVIRPRELARGTRPTEDDGADYELVRVLGRGAMGVVYAARQKSINRSVAVKMLTSHLAEDLQQREQFLAEAVVTGELGHPNIVPIYDLAINQAGELFYSMKEVNGTPWSEVLLGNTLLENLDIWMRVADATAFAHDRGVIHRDLKPENVMVGGFGEVLLMDWGIAISREMLADPVIRSTSGLGGTPAYMAPEMGTEGPLHRIQPAADIYLLGAILYEIVTGQPPHAGENVWSCLRAAVRNEIQPTDKSGELLDIAHRAMATDPQQRYADVKQMQAAVREHLSHAQSNTLVLRGEELLEQARQTGDYNRYQQAILAFREALALWHENQRAFAALDEACIACAQRALQTGDYDLGLSVLDPNQPSHAPLIRRLKAGRRRRNSVRAVIIALLSVIVVGSVGAAIWIDAERQEAENQRQIAAANEQRALENAETARRNAETAEKNALDARLNAEQAERSAEQAERSAEQAREHAQRALAEQLRAEKNEKAALRQKRIAQLRAEEATAAAYRSKIGLAASQVEANAFNRAKAELDEIALRSLDSPQFNPPPWEYNRLRYMLRLSDQTTDAGFPLQAAAVSPDGLRVAVGGGAGQVLVYQPGRDLPQVFDTGFQQVTGVVFSASGKRLVTAATVAAPDEQGKPAFATEIAVWDADGGTRLQAFPGRPGDWVRALAVHGTDDGLLVVAGIEQPGAAAGELTTDVARIWQQDRAPVLLVGHLQAVLAVAISPDGRTILSADDLGVAQIWQRSDEGDFVLLREHATELFMPHHKEPVFAVRFSPDGSRVATAGGDQQIHIWPHQDLVQPEIAPGDLVPELSLAGHASAVLDIGFSADGRRLVSGGEDGTLRVWDLERGQQLALLRGHSNAVGSCGFSPQDPDRILSAAADQELRVWSLAGYRESLAIRSATLPDMLSARFSPDGQQVVTAHRRDVNYGASAIWPLEFTGDRPSLGHEPPRLFREGHTLFVLHAQAGRGPRAAELVTVGADGTACFWDAEQGRELLRVSGVARRLNYGSPSVVTSQDGRWILAAAGGCHAVHLWDRQQIEADAGAPPDHELRYHSDPIAAVAISNSGGLLFSGDQLGHGALWTAATEGAGFAPAWTVEPLGIPISAAWFAPDESRLFCVSAYQVRQFDTATGREYTGGRLSHSDHVTSAALTDDGQRLLVGCADGSLSLWDVSQPESAQTPLSVVRHGQRKIQAVDISRDGRFALEVAADKSVRVYFLTPNGSFEAPREYHLPGMEAESAAFYRDDGSQIVAVGGVEAALWDLAAQPQPQRLHQYSAEGVPASVGFSHDGRLLVTAHRGGAVKLWDAAAGRLHCRLEGHHQGGVNFACFSPDDQFVWTAGEDGLVLRWRSDSGAYVDSFCQLEGGLAIHHLALSPDGESLAIAAEDGNVALWDVASATRRRVLPGHAGAVRCVAFSPDGRWLASGGDDQTARLWDPESAQGVAVLRGHTKRVAAIAFCPHGRRLATGSADGTAKLWAMHQTVPIPSENPDEPEQLEAELLTVDEILTLKQHRDEVTSVEFSADGKNLLTSGRDGQAIVWPSASAPAARP